MLTFLPARRHTAGSAVNIRQLPTSVMGLARSEASGGQLAVRIKGDGGELLASGIPSVRLVKDAQQFGGDAAPDDCERDAAGEVEILARIDHNLRHAPLAGFVAEGAAPYGFMSEAVDAALRRAAFSGMPVVKVGRGNNEGFSARVPPSSRAPISPLPRPACS